MGMLKSPRGQCHRRYRFAVCFVLQVFSTHQAFRKRRPASSIERFWLWTKRRQLADVPAGFFLRGADIDNLARLFDRHVEGLIAFQSVQRQVIGFVRGRKVRTVLGRLGGPKFSPRAITQVNNSVAIRVAVLQRMGAFEGVIVMLQHQSTLCFSNSGTQCLRLPSPVPALPWLQPPSA